MPAPRIGSSADASTLRTARWTTPLPSRPAGGGGEGRSVGSSGSSGRALKIACRLDEGFENCPTKCIRTGSDQAGVRLREQDGSRSLAGRKPQRMSAPTCRCGQVIRLSRTREQPHSSTASAGVLLRPGVEREHHRDARHGRAVVYVDLARFQTPLELLATHTQVLARSPAKTSGHTRRPSG